MFKQLMALIWALCATLALAAVDVNKASQADLETVKGIGPATATRIVDARKQGPFKNWEDLMDRVKGIAATTAGKLSQQGLTVNGQTYKAPAAATPNASVPKGKSEKPAQSASKKPENV